MRDVAQALAGQADHFVRDVYAMNLGEMAAERFHEAAGSTADFERSRARTLGQSPELSFQIPKHVGGGREKTFFVLIAPAESDVVV
jgi:hypothetical protein